MATNSSGLTIRPATANDSDALYDICLRTANAGVDATALYSDPRLPGYIWSAPYGVLAPDFAFMLASPEEAIGYIVGTPDSWAFARREESEWWPTVRAALGGFMPKTEQDRGALQGIQQPEMHGAWLAEDYPAHLHINILPEAQSGGWGRRLIDTELSALKATGVKGVHLGVAPRNERAIGFYRHVGFQDISRDGRVIFGLKFR